MARTPRRALPAGIALAVVLIALLVLPRSGGPLAPDRPSSEGHSSADSAREGPGRWVGSWSASPVAAEPGTRKGLPGLSLRNVVRLSVGGSAARVRLSNAYGTAPLTLAHATAALAAPSGGPRAVSGSLRELTFGGGRSVTVPPGGSVLSDPVKLRVPDAARLLVTAYVPAPSSGVTHHPHARQTSYTARGDHASDTSGAPYTGTTPYWRYLTAVDVWTTEADGALVVLGDSLTDGITSTAGADRRWTDHAAARLRRSPRLGVLNQGIAGNRVLSGPSAAPAAVNPSGLERFERDVLSATGATAVLIELGLNDILRPLPPRRADAGEIVAGLRRLAERARARGLTVLGATLTPFEGSRQGTAKGEAVRQAVNREIRAGRVFDAVVDFDRALRDPARPARLLPAYDSGDHVHPSDAGYEVMAGALDPRLPAPRARTSAATS